MLRLNAEIANIDIRRTGNKSVSGDVITGQTQGIAHENAIAQQLPVVMKRLQRRSLLASLRFLKKFSIHLELILLVLGCFLESYVNPGILNMFSHLIK